MAEMTDQERQRTSEGVRHKGKEGAAAARASSRVATGTWEPNERKSSPTQGQRRLAPSMIIPSRERRLASQIRTSKR